MVAVEEALMLKLACTLFKRFNLHERGTGGAHEAQQRVDDEEMTMLLLLTSVALAEVQMRCEWPLLLAIAGNDNGYGVRSFWAASAAGETRRAHQDVSLANHF